MLTAIAGVVEAASEAGIGLSVCGDAAADPAVLPRLLALGVRTVSVGAAKVPAVAGWIAGRHRGGTRIGDRAPALTFKRGPPRAMAELRTGRDGARRAVRGQSCRRRRAVAGSSRDPHRGRRH